MNKSQSSDPTATNDAAELKARVQGGVEAGAGFGEVHAMFVAFAAAGGLQADAERVINELFLLWRDSDERKADLIADVGDFVVGWCVPEAAIWRNPT